MSVVLLNLKYSQQYFSFVNLIKLMLETRDLHWYDWALCDIMRRFPSK